MKILINGNLGYVGPVVVRHFRHAFPSASLVGFDSGFFSDCLIDPKKFPDEPVDEQMIGDVRNIPARLFEGIDAVVQLAAISNDPMGKEYEKATAEINARAVLENALRAKKAGVKAFVFASSCSVYGAGGSDAKKESSPIDPLTAYARSKVEAERALGPLAASNFTITCLRFATACGFSPRIRLDLVLNDFVASALATGAIEILSDGTPWRPLIHVRDMARAIEWAITRSRDKGGDFLTVNAGSDKWNYRISELAEAVAHVVHARVSVNGDAAPDKRSYRVDFGLFRKLAPAHQPLETLESAIADISENLLRAGFVDSLFRTSPKYIRLRTLSSLRRSGRLTDNLFWQ